MAGTRPHGIRPETTLVAAVAAVYVVIMAGATTAVLDATAACAGWPTCDGRLLVPLDNPEVVVALAHRVAALAAGILVLVAGVVAWRNVPSRRVHLVLLATVVLYPAQVAIGALIAVAGPAPVYSGLHLVVGVTIFALLVVALAWTLTATKPDLTVTTTRPQRPIPTGDPSQASPGGNQGVVRAYLRLTKPRLMWLLCLVAVAGMVLAAGRNLTPHVVIATLLGGVLAIGASGTFNNILERDLDRRMHRTADRPLPTTQIPVRNAAVFGVALAVASVGVFLTINRLAAILGLAAILYYSVVYTLVLKPNTPQNTVIGGLAGSFPAVIGAAAATNTIGLPALLLALVIFLWTPAHFYNLALAYKDDYARGEVPMFPVVRGDPTTVRHVLFYLGATLIAAAVLAYATDLGAVYAAATVAFGLGFLWSVLLLHREETRAAALRSFHASNAFLGALLVAIVIDGLAL